MALTVKRKDREDGKIELSITAPGEKVDEAIRFITFQLAMQNNIPPQMTPDLSKAVIEKVGEAYFKSFVDFQVPQFLAPFAVSQEKLDIAMKPEVIASGASVTPGKEYSFKAVVTKKPIYEVSSYDPVTIKVPVPQVAEEEIDQQLVTLAENYATYEKDEDHPVAEGNDILISIDTKDFNGDAVPNLTAERRQFTLGQQFMPEEFDQNLLGMKVGESKTFELLLPGFVTGKPDSTSEQDKVTITVKILEIQKRVVPAITDEWVAKTIPGAKTVPELREQIREQGLSMRQREVENMTSYLAASEFAKRFQGKIPDEYYEFTREELMSQLQQNLHNQNIQLQDYIEQQGGGQQQFGMMMMLQTREVLVQGFSLDALARHLKLSLEPADVEETFRLMAPGHEREARMEFEGTGRMYLIYEAALRNKANKWLVETATIEKAE
ncbi:MAG: hypothetical protein LBR39_01750 [Coriobacteriales bacterium]|nr:hypothetical protein [Coriobacteriales bacterium]